MTKREKAFHFLAQAVGGATVLLIAVMTWVFVTEVDSAGAGLSVWLVDAVFVGLALVLLLALWLAQWMFLPGNGRDALKKIAKSTGSGVVMGLGIFAVGALMVTLGLLVTQGWTVG